MAKKLSINVSGGPLASGFFSPETIKKAESEEVISTESAAPQTISEELPKPKNKGGRPRLDKKKRAILTYDGSGSLSDIEKQGKRKTQVFFSACHRCYARFFK